MGTPVQGMCPRCNVGKLDNLGRCRNPDKPGGIFCAYGWPEPEQKVATFQLESVDHPYHYGGKDNPFEAIKVIEAWRLGFCLGNCVKYIARAGKKGSRSEDLKKARWYLDRAIDRLNKEVIGESDSI